jgi:hypothetical protein
MLHAYLTSRAARPVVAFLLAGSMMGFALGQQLGHHPAQAQHTISTVARPLASGSLGARTLDQPIHTAPATGHSAPANAKRDKKPDGGGHQGGDGGKGGGGGGDAASND